MDNYIVDSYLNNIPQITSIDKNQRIYSIATSTPRLLTKLANDMMRLESRLFHEVLIKLYNKRYRVVSIHDAIVVLDVRANINLEQYSGSLVLFV